jgi:single-stranded-DNA-specific exonuclease
MILIPTPDELQSLLIDRLNLSDQQKQDFLFPKYEFGNFWDFEDMSIAVERIYKAVKSGEQIGIYADYDCDGIPGAVILMDLFKALKVESQVHVYIPDRHDEGYGLSTVGIDALEAKGVTLIITVDLGITAIAEVADARSRGIDTIVTDHHAPLSQYPAALAVVHPKKGNYINQEPCGAAVAFYLLCAFLEKHREGFGIKEGYQKWSLDMAGFATISDMMPLLGENRMLVTYGMMVMKKTRRVGLQTFFKSQYIDPYNLTETDLSFTLAPRLNAASRMDTPMLAFELLSTNDADRALVLAKQLEKINAERKLLVARIVKESHKKLETRELPEIVVLGDLSWRPAVLGLVATKLQETYQRSFFVWGESGDGLIKGSCRMLPSHHAALLFQALPEGTLLHSGGHQAAGGFAVSKEKIHFFEQELNKAIGIVDHKIEEKNNSEAISMPLGIVTTRHLQKIRALAPFGIANPQPSFVFENIKVLGTKMFGKNKEHLECELQDVGGIAIAFNFFTDEDMINKIIAGESIAFIGTLEAGWRGGVRVRIQNLL